MFDGKDFEIAQQIAEMWQHCWRCKLFVILLWLFHFGLWLLAFLLIAGIIKNL